MSRIVALCLALVLLVPAAAMAKELKRKPLQLDALGVEVSATTEYTDDMYKALRKADRCLTSDGNWKREQERPGDSAITANQLYDMLAGSVVCWQDAEKKAKKMGDGFTPATLWISARARYIEAYRQFIWSIDAKQSGDRPVLCRRLVEAGRLLDASTTAATGLAAKYQTPGAQALGAQADTEAQSLSAMVIDELTNQKCD